MAPRTSELTSDETPNEFGEEVEGDDRDLAVTPSDLTVEEGVELTLGYVRDYVSGRQVRATPEEVQAVQIFVRRLVEDYGYARDHIIAHPQYRVRRSPSDIAKSFPVRSGLRRRRRLVPSLSGS
ncbi:MAG: putative methylase [Chloroflexi bacterium]|nr:putative methylase [Chloroflexota bacterium]